MSFLKVGLVFFLSSASSYSAADVAKCSGDAQGYGRVAFSFETGLFGEIVLRGCNLVNEIAVYFDGEPKRYDTYIMEGFGDVNCKKLSDAPVAVACSINNKLLADNLREDIGNEFRKVLTHGSLNFSEVEGRRLSIDFTIDIPNFMPMKRHLLLENVTCNNEAIAPDEGVCD
ncbi:MAG: hypothetical protein NTV34_03310 [Proteobacteria bacterium]|nr:hypothetical protein [Pseudomonadota bacterium]